MNSNSKDESNDESLRVPELSSADQALYDKLPEYLVKAELKLGRVPTEPLTIAEEPLAPPAELTILSGFSERTKSLVANSPMFRILLV